MSTIKSSQSESTRDDIDELRRLVLLVVREALECWPNSALLELARRNRGARDTTTAGAVIDLDDARSNCPPTRVLSLAIQHLETTDARTSLAAIARQLGCSRSYLAQLFHRHVGTTPAAWRRHQRLTKAADMIRAGTKIEAVALAVGFKSRSAFNHAFRKQFGCVPGELRAGRPATDSPDAVSPLTAKVSDITNRVVSPL